MIDPKTPTVTGDEMKRLIKAAIFTPTMKGWGLPLMFWGDPGVVKSDMVRQVAAAYGMHLEVLSPGERGEGAFGVTPMPVARSGTFYMTYPEPEWLLDFEEHDGRGIVFVDEIPHAPPAVQPALLGLLLDRRIGASYLGAGVRVLGAGNPPGEGSGGYELSAAAANRVCHIDWIAPTFAEWARWMDDIDPDDPLPAKEKSPFNAEDEEQRVLAAWADAFKKARTTIIAFLRFKTSYLHVKPGEDSPQLFRAWPSRRTWTFATYALAAAEVHDCEDLETMLVAGFVGPAAGGELIAYKETIAKLPSAADVLDERREFEIDPIRLDITYTVLQSCALLVADPACQARKRRLVKFWTLLQDLIEEGIHDVAATSARIVARSPSTNSARPTEGKEAQAVMAALRPVMEAAGYVL